MYHYYNSNRGLFEGIQASGCISSKRVLQAMIDTDRAVYCLNSAYFDSPQPLGCSQTISAPHMHAHALSHLEPALQPGMRALDVGSGSGYLTACMARLVGVLEGEGYVLGIDIYPELVEQAKTAIEEDDSRLLQCGLLDLKVGDGWNPPVHESERFNAIHVGAAANTVPEALMKLLAPHGIMFIPVGDQYSTQKIQKITKDADGKHYKVENLFDVMYVPLQKK